MRKYPQWFTGRAHICKYISMSATIPLILLPDASLTRLRFDNLSSVLVSFFSQSAASSADGAPAGIAG